MATIHPYNFPPLHRRHLLCSRLPRVQTPHQPRRRLTNETGFLTQVRHVVLVMLLLVKVFPTPTLPGPVTSLWNHYPWHLLPWLLLPLFHQSGNSVILADHLALTTHLLIAAAAEVGEVGGEPLPPFSQLSNERRHQHRVLQHRHLVLLARMLFDTTFASMFLLRTLLHRWKFFFPLCLLFAIAFYRKIRL